ncbi:hypothetical protein VNO80_25243 [Phaseolus coccineus]|uniref:Uncharacterized protein n=1 Tax=Phaseolus coccineus TaxID=3886 RepID=A0AAN9LUX0_PHACN
MFVKLRAGFAGRQLYCKLEATEPILKLKYPTSRIESLFAILALDLNAKVLSLCLPCVVTTVGWIAYADRVSYPLCPSLSCWNKASFNFLGKAQSDEASLRRSWNLTGFLRLGLRMPTHFDSREKPRKWKSDQRPGPSGPERQVPQIFSFQSNLDSREKPSLWTRVSDALSDNGLAMTRSSLQS